MTCRLMEEVDEVVGDKETVDAGDLENLKYMQQVCTALCSHVSYRQVISAFSILKVMSYIISIYYLYIKVVRLYPHLFF